MIAGYHKGLAKTGWLVFGLVVIWLPMALAVASEVHWMLVEQPRRIQAGEPIE